MGNLQVKNLFYWFAFLVLGFFSCYWTADSLYIWQPVLGKAGAWLVAILFYVMASLSFTLVMNALDRNTDFYGKFLGRGASLIVGTVGLLLFWLACSMPTNTHTLLYNAEIRSTASQDLANTLSYLSALENKNSEIEKINARYESKEGEVAAIFTRMLAELQDPSNKGIGPRFRVLVADLNTALSGIDPKATGGKPIQEVKNPGSNINQWLATYYQYKMQAEGIMKIYRANCDNEIARVRNSLNGKNSNYKALVNDCETARREIQGMKGVNAGLIAAAQKDLEDAYSYINTNAKYITFTTPEDSALYSREKPVTRVRELQVIPQVWHDYLLTDKYNGHGFIWWVLIAVLVDIAGFIFFYLANKGK